MKRKTTAILIVSLMILASFVITVNAEKRSTVPKDDATEEATLDGFGTIKGYVKRGIGRFGVNDADVTGKSAFGTYSTKTNWQGYYVLDGLQLSKRRDAYYDVTVNKNGYEKTEEGVHVTEEVVWLNFTLPSGGDSYSENLESPENEDSLTDINDADSANSNMIDEGQETGEIVENETPMDSSTSRDSESSSAQSASSPLNLIMRLFQRLFLFLGV